MCSRSVNPHLLRSDPLHKTLDNTHFTLSLISTVEEKYWILHTGGKVFHILIQRSMLSSSIFFRCQYILAFTNEPSDIILSSNSETRYLLHSFMGELKIFLIVRFKKVFHFQNTCVSILSEICLALARRDSCLQLRERTRYWCRNQQGALSDQILGGERENCSWRKLQNWRKLRSEKSFCGGEEWLWWWKPSFWTCTRIWESKWKKLKLNETKKKEISDSWSLNFCWWMLMATLSPKKSSRAALPSNLTLCCPTSITQSWK